MSLRVLTPEHLLLKLTGLHGLYLISNSIKDTIQINPLNLYCLGVHSFKIVILLSLITLLENSIYDININYLVFV